MNKTCNHCRFALKEGVQLYCHRAPPTTVSDAAGLHFFWPAVMGASWCGEWKLAWRRLFRGHVQS